MWSFHSWLRGGMRALNRKFEYALQVGSALIGSEFWGRDHLPGTFQAAAALKTTVRAQNTIEPHTHTQYHKQGCLKSVFIVAQTTHSKTHVHI